MGCSEFIDGFSDYFDGVGDPAFVHEAEAHLSSCRSCRRYLEVIERGGELFRSAPSVRISRDFYPRLRHRLFHLEDAEALSRGASGSATTAATILGMAILLTLVAWSPLIRMGEPEVALSPIVVSRPAQRSLGLRPPPVSFSNEVASAAGFDGAVMDLWERPNFLLYEYSPLSERYGRGTGILRTGFD